MYYRTQPNNYKKKYSHTNVRKNSFSQRIVDDWNRLLEDLILNKTVNSFKPNLDKVWKYLPVKFEADHCYGPEPQSVKKKNMKTDPRGQGLDRSNNSVNGVSNNMKNKIHVNVL